LKKIICSASGKVNSSIGIPARDVAHLQQDQRKGESDFGKPEPNKSFRDRGDANAQ
jgi:hypothetical protein